MIGRLVALVIAGSSAVVTSQFPEFVQQYSQRLGGAVDELTSFVTQFDADAASSGLSRKQAVEEYRNSENGFLGLRGVSVVGTIDRYERLSSLKKSLDEAGPVARLGTFFKDLESDIAQTTWGDYQPAVPVTMEGAIHAGAGFGLGLVLALLGRGSVRTVRRKMARPPEETPGSPS